VPALRCGPFIVSHDFAPVAARLVASRATARQARQ